MFHPFNNPFTRPNVGAPDPRHPFGFWLNYRKQITSAYAPSRHERQKIRGGKRFDYVVAYSLNAQDTDTYAATFPGVFTLCYILGDQTAISPGLQVEFFDSDRQEPLTDIPVYMLQAAGTAQQPFILRKFYTFEKTGTLLVRLTNLASVVNAGQIVLHGYVMPPDTPSEYAAFEIEGAGAGLSLEL
jgi:hypothetical protein